MLTPLQEWQTIQNQKESVSIPHLDYKEKIEKCMLLVRSNKIFTDVEFMNNFTQLFQSTHDQLVARVNQVAKDARDEIKLVLNGCMIGFTKLQKLKHQISLLQGKTTIQNRLGLEMSNERAGYSHCIEVLDAHDTYTLGARILYLIEHFVKIQAEAAVIITNSTTEPDMNMRRSLMLNVISMGNEAKFLRQQYLVYWKMSRWIQGVTKAMHVSEVEMAARINMATNLMEGIDLHSWDIVQSEEEAIAVLQQEGIA